MISLSLCMIVKNEEKTLPKCLTSARELVDEIVIVDTGSTDDTKKVAARYTDKIYDFEWMDDFSAARNFAFSQAKGDFILWLDADDYILPSDLALLKELKRELSGGGDAGADFRTAGASIMIERVDLNGNTEVAVKNVDANEGAEVVVKNADAKAGDTTDVQVVMLRYNTGFDENGRVTFSFFRERLVRRSAGFLWREPVHEYIETFGKTIYREAAITHTQKTKQQAKAKAAEGRNVRIYEGILSNGKSLSPRGTYYYARELWDAGRYEDAATRFREFLAGKKGWVEDNIAASGALSECLLLTNKRQEALSALFASFEYDNPRPEICCKIGYYFKLEKKYNQAAYWFETALKAADEILAKGGRSLGFFQQDYYGYIPSIELAVCLSRLGDNAKANEYNERAAGFKPHSPSVISNREYFKKVASPHI